MRASLTSRSWRNAQDRHFHFRLFLGEQVPQGRSGEYSPHPQGHQKATGTEGTTISTKKKKNVVTLHGLWITGSVQ